MTSRRNVGSAKGRNSTTQRTVSQASIPSHFSPVATRLRTCSSAENRLEDHDSPNPTIRTDSTCSPKDRDDSRPKSGQLSTDKEEPANISARDILIAVQANRTNIEKINTSVEKLCGAVLSLQIENEKMKKEIDQLKKNEEQLRSELHVAKRRAEMADEKTNDLEQYDRNYNIRIFHVDEPENETPTQCEETVIKLFHNKLGLRHIQKSDIDAVHRLGPKKAANNSRRAIIVRFVSRKTRHEVLSNRRKLKQNGSQGKSIVIVEDLTKRNYQLYCSARDSSITQRAWSHQGKIYVKATSGKISHIQRKSDLNDPGLRDAHAHAREPQRRATAPREEEARSQSQSPNPGLQQPRRNSGTRESAMDSDGVSDNEDENDKDIDNSPADTIWG